MNWLPEHEEFVRKHGPALGFQSVALQREFNAHFNTSVAYSAMHQFGRRIKYGGRVIPPSARRTLSEDVLRATCRAALITSDWQVPFHDHEWAEFAFEIGKGFNCDLHVINGDFLDGHSLSKFDPQLYDEKRAPEEELLLVEEILFQSCKAFGSTIMDMGNHEWRYWRKWMQASIGPQRFLRLLTDEDRVHLTEFSYVILNDSVRCTHPRNYSKIPNRVGADLAAKYHQHIIAAHGHNIGQRRDISGKYTVVDSGGMFDPGKLDYINTVDSINPLINQGFVVYAHETLYLFDARNTDREFWRWALRKQGYFQRKPEVK